jgi:hypothetical protein
MMGATTRQQKTTRPSGNIRTSVTWSHFCARLRDGEETVLHTCAVTAFVSLGMSGGG